MTVSALNTSGLDDSRLFGMVVDVGALDDCELLWMTVM